MPYYKYTYKKFYGYYAYKNTDGTFHRGNAPGSGTTAGNKQYLYDNINDGGGDSPTQIGDVSNDHFNAYIAVNGHTIEETFVGSVDNGKYFVAQYNYNNNSYYDFFSPNKLTPGHYGKADNFTVSPDTPVALCYAAGTLIRTARGNVAVENLRTGDLAVTASGAQRPIRWLGHRDVDCTALDAPHKVWPVRIRAGAFGAALPERDLRLSPGHPVLVCEDEDEYLVPIMCLINGTSIDRVQVPSITYWHVELDEHDILLAEGLPAESFLDYGTRAWFGPDADAHALANPDFVVPGLGARCRPVALDGPIVEAERRRLDALFATGLAAMSAWPPPTWDAVSIGF